MKNNFIRRMLTGLLTACVCTVAAPVMAFTPENNALNGSLTGLWNNTAEAGWGMTTIHQYGTIFATFYTYDAAGVPTWYVASACAVAGTGCTGPLYSVKGGSDPIAAWNAPNKVVSQVGNLSLAFSDGNTGTMSFSINGSNGMKPITRSIFASAPASAAPPSAPVAAVCTSSHVNLTHFNTITNGMTLERVNQTIGCAYDPSSTVLTSSTSMYQWNLNPSFSENGFATGGKVIMVYFDAASGLSTSKSSTGL